MPGKLAQSGLIPHLWALTFSLETLSLENTRTEGVSEANRRKDVATTKRLYRRVESWAHQLA